MHKALFQLQYSYADFVSNDPKMTSYKYVFMPCVQVLKSSSSSVAENNLLGTKQEYFIPISLRSFSS